MSLNLQMILKQSLILTYTYFKHKMIICNQILYEVAFDANINPVMNSDTTGYFTLI